MSTDGNGENPKLAALASRTAEESKNGAVPEVIEEDDTPLPGISVLKRPRTPVETELLLLREAYQEHGKTLGQVLSSIARLEKGHLETSEKLDQVITLLSKLRTGAGKRP
jgi:hypothetical protein